MQRGIQMEYYQSEDVKRQTRYHIYRFMSMLELNPPAEDEITISQETVAAFKEWMDN